MNLDKLIERAVELLLELDDGARRTFEPYADSPLVAALHPLSKLGDQPQLRTLSGAMILAGVLMRDHRLTRAGSRMIIAHETATFVKETIKFEVDRTRPRSATTKQQNKPRKGNHTSKELTSFPSGHSAGSMAVARAFEREYPELGPYAVGAAAAIALLQIPRCAHYPTDVAAGLVIGVVAELASNALWQAAGVDEREGYEANQSASAPATAPTTPVSA
jgi:undecaprenyl-diphosphatase